MSRFRVVYDDRDVVVVDKAPGVLTVPTAKRERSTLVDMLSAHLRREVFVVHRLDRDTSGLLVFAKDRRAARALADTWAEHERLYDALVHGVVRVDAGVVESRLITGKNLDRRSTRDPRASGAPAFDRGERAVTRYRVVERVRAATLVECALETGRRNRIRVHMKDLGHRLLGDARYARDVRPHPLWRGGLALHARVLAFIHPVTGARLRFDAGMRADFAAFLAAARRST